VGSVDGAGHVRLDAARFGRDRVGYLHLRVKPPWPLCYLRLVLKRAGEAP